MCRNKVYPDFESAPMEVFPSHAAARKQFGGLIITENGRDTACHSPDALRFSQVDRRWKFTAVGNAAGEQQGMRFGPQLDRRLFFNNVTGGWNVKWSRLVPKAGRI